MAVGHDLEMLEEPALLAQGARHLTSRLPAQSRWWAAGWLVPLAVQLAHTIAVAPTYRVGSFDDDANYLMAAHVLASGGWLTSVMPNGATVVANYLPGYPLLLVPVVWLFGAALWPPRLLSSILVAALYPLLWAWMARRGLSPWCRAAVMVVLAINSVLATYSTMVMAESPFLVVFVLTLFSLDRWAARPGTFSATVAVVLLAYLVWLKEAGIGLAVGLVAYELWHRHWRRATGVTLGVGALLLPGLAARWASGSQVVGDRYSTEIAHPGQGGLLHQLVSEAPHVARSYLQNVLRQSVLPEGSPLPAHGAVNALLNVVGTSVPLLVGVGAVVWYRRVHRPELWMLAAYFAETLAYPYTNQRRVVLVLPLVTIWYVVGAQAAGGWARRRAGAVGSRSVAALAGVAAVLVLLVPTAAGFTRNYLWGVGQKSSEFASSPAVSFLRAIGTPDELVETSYRGSIAYFTGHRTGWTAETSTTVTGPFGNQNDGQCRVHTVKAALREDDAKFLVVGDFNAPDFMDSPCLLQLASKPSTARALDIVRLLSTSHDQTSVFELLGPGTPQPGLVDWTAGVTPVVPPQPGRRGGKPATSPGQPTRTVRLARNGQGDQGGTGYVAVAHNGRAQLTWHWRTPVAITQLSLGSVGSASPITSVTVTLETPARTWQVVGDARGPVGDSGVVPYLLARLRPGSTAYAVRVTALARGAVKVTYVNAIGPEPGGR
jgi:hypothetical protein